MDEGDEMDKSKDLTLDVNPKLMGFDLSHSSISSLLHSL
jgi:hypothetical protein